MGDRRSARLRPELSNFYCLPAEPGDLPWLLGDVKTGG
jgi:hypothetical protein